MEGHWKIPNQVVMYTERWLLMMIWVWNLGPAREKTYRSRSSKEGRQDTGTHGEKGQWKRCGGRSILQHLLKPEVFETALSIFSLIGRMENVDRYGLRGNRILELVRVIETDLVMNVRRHSTTSLKNIRIELEKRSWLLPRTALLLLEVLLLK